MTEQRFFDAETHQQFMDNMPSEDRPSYDSSLDAARSEVMRLEKDRLPEQTTYILSVCERWCMDTRANVPVVAALAERASSFKLNEQRTGH